MRYRQGRVGRREGREKVFKEWGRWGKGHAGLALLGALQEAQAPRFPGAHFGFIPSASRLFSRGFLPQACPLAALEAWAGAQGRPLRKREA